ncbi:MAG: MOSC N-terminal beta barrel domain-containing protein, partial [Mucilaginibacter sp.]
MLQVSELYIYPIKSLSGIAVKSAKITDRGFEHDRRWLLVDAQNRFLTQREQPQMALLQTIIENNELKITHKLNNQWFSIAMDTPPAGGRATVTIWDDTCEAEFVSVAADEWFSAMLGLQCRLVYMPDKTRRIVDQRYAPENSVTSFSDAYPFLIIGR